MEANDRTDAFREALRQAIGQERHDVWFDDRVSIEVTTDRVIVFAPNAFHRDRLRTQFRDAAHTVATRLLPEAGGVEFSVRDVTLPEAITPEPARPTPAAQSTAAARSTAPASATRPAPPPSDPLADWVENDSAAEAVTACRQIVEGRFTASPVLLWGAPGVGKTHLLRAIADGVRARTRQRRVLLVTAEQFTVGFVAALHGSGIPSFRAKHREVGLLLLDNAHQLVGKQRTTEEFLHTLDALASTGGQVVLTSDRSPAELAQLGPELASRLAGGVATPLRMPDAACRAELIARAATQRQLPLSRLACETLAATLHGGAREVSGALNRISLLHETFELELDDALMRRVAAEINRLSTPRVGIDQIEAAVCRVFGVGPKDLRSQKRTKAVTEPRMLAMWLSRKLTGSAWSEIGDHFGRRSHSTVIAAHRRVERLLASSNPPRMTGSAGDLHEAIRRVESALRIA